MTNARKVFDLARFMSSYLDYNCLGGEHTVSMQFCLPCNWQLVYDTFLSQMSVQLLFCPGEHTWLKLLGLVIILGDN